MKIIGFGGSGHDWSVCILDGARIVVALDEERPSRLKYGIGSNLLQSQARTICLETAGLTAADLDYAVACDLVPLTLAAPFRRRLVRIQHHLAHAYGAFYGSPFDRAAVMVVDNAGSILDGKGNFTGQQRTVETLTYWHAHDRKICAVGGVSGQHLLDAQQPGDYFQQVGETDNSLGHLYWTISEAVGFVYRPENGAVTTEDGKTMGLASYGDDRYLAELSPYLTLLDDGQYTIRLADGEFRAHIQALLKHGPNTPDAALAREAAVARAGQIMLENALLHCAKYVRKKTGERYLTMNGGVALNCVANTRIAREAGFDDLFILPAAGDNGNALGAALYGLIELAEYKGPLDIYHQLPFLGPCPTASALAQGAAAAEAGGARQVACTNVEQLAADYLAQGKIVAWFEGRSEFGPRALGHRSILADPRPADMKDRINHIIKKREPFRPFAPMVLAEQANEVFDMPVVAVTPFMLTIGDVRPAYLGQLPAITHVDNTARVQLITRERYPRMHRVISAFAQQTGLPVILNTSFNQAGEPIVESPLDAVRCFLDTEMEMLVLEDKVFVKETSCLN